jgi:cytidylate kinase
LTQRERNRFVRDHFYADPTDPQNYDLVLNVSHLMAKACVDLLVAVLATYRAQLSAGT